MEKLIQMFNRWLAIRRFVRRYKYTIEVNKILEEYLTNSIISGGSDQMVAETRKQLLANQNDTKNQQKFLDFLKTL